VDKVKTVALYVRVSSTEQSTDMQKRELMAYVQARGWKLHLIYEDQLTGTNDKRPAFQACMTDARARRFDVLLVWKLDRFGRSLKDVVNKMSEISELGIDFVCITQQIDLTTSAGRMMSHLLAAFAEFEADMIKSRVRAGIANARAKGTKLGRPIRIDPAQVQSLRASGLSLSAIAKRVGSTKSGVSKILSRHALKKSVTKSEKTGSET
jgi:putative DNA-invertase from lambdoid prophage Rac